MRTKTLLIGVSLALLGLSLVPTASARTCVLGDNPNALLNVCVLDSGSGITPYVHTYGGSCIIGNFCPNVYTGTSPSDQCATVGSRITDPSEFTLCPPVIA